jgi:8-oxo-dGTP diphosphatase
MRVVVCFLDYEGRFVVLLRHEHKPDGDTWGLAGGKVEKGESDETAVLREIEEETGYVADASQLEHLGDFNFISTRDEPFVCVTYRIKLSSLHDVRIETSAHAEYRWVTAQECAALPNLIPDFYELLRLTKYI